VAKIFKIIASVLGRATKKIISCRRRFSGAAGAVAAAARATPSGAAASGAARAAEGGGMILVAEVAVVDKVVDGGQVRAGRNVRAVEHVNTLMFVACYAYSVLTRDNMRQSDVGFCFVGSYTQTINVWVGCIDTRSSTQHYYLIIVCL
jgi:hypothetical protein